MSRGVEVLGPLRGVYIYIPSRARGRVWIPFRETRQAGRIGHLGLFMGIYMGSL